MSSITDSVSVSNRRVMANGMCLEYPLSQALKNALAEIKAVTFEPKQTLPAVKRRIDGEPEAVAHGL